MSYSPTNPLTFPFNPAFPLLPAQISITAITQAKPCVITTSGAHGYADGQQVRIVLPFPYQKYFGMYQIDGATGFATVLSPTTFSIPVDTRSYNSFSVGTALQTAQVIPIGETAQLFTSVFEQVNPANNQSLVDVPIFQNQGLQGSSGTYRP